MDFPVYSKVLYEKHPYIVNTLKALFVDTHCTTEKPPSNKVERNMDDAVLGSDDEATGERVFRLIGLAEKTRWKVPDDSQQRLSLTSLLSKCICPYCKMYFFMMRCHKDLKIGLQMPTNQQHQVWTHHNFIVEYF